MEKRKKSNKQLRNRSIIIDTFHFIMEKKRWWLIPILVLLILVAILIIAIKMSSVSPFVYALF